MSELFTAKLSLIKYCRKRTHVTNIFILIKMDNRLDKNINFRKNKLVCQVKVLEFENIVERGSNFTTAKETSIQVDNR